MGFFPLFRMGFFREPRKRTYQLQGTKILNVWNKPDISKWGVLNWSFDHVILYYCHIFQPELFGHVARQLPYIILCLEPLRTELPARKSEIGSANIKWTIPRNKKRRSKDHTALLKSCPETTQHNVPKKIWKIETFPTWSQIFALMWFFNNLPMQQV